MKKIQLLYSEDAVSEVVDFVTILGILVISIGIIGVAGYPMVKNAQEANYIENTKQSFIVLAENVNKVVLGQAPSQNMEIKLYGGTLSTKGTSEINVTTSSGTLIDQQMRSIESIVGNTVIAYEGTGVWAKYPTGNTIMISKPLITDKNGVIVIPVVYVGGLDSVGGNGMNRLVVDGVPYLSNISKNVNSVSIIINNSAYWDGWQKYLNTLGFTCSGSSSSFTCTLYPTTNVDVYTSYVWLNTEIT